MTGRVRVFEDIETRIRSKYLQSTSKVGTRVQMFNMQKSKLENDFLIEECEYSFHILNAISAAWTSAFPFVRYVCNHHIL